MKWHDWMNPFVWLFFLFVSMYIAFEKYFIEPMGRAGRWIDERKI